MLRGDASPTGQLGPTTCTSGWAAAFRSSADDLMHLLAPRWGRRTAATRDAGPDGRRPRRRTASGPRPSASGALDSWLDPDVADARARLHAGLIPSRDDDAGRASSAPEQPTAGPDGDAYDVTRRPSPAGAPDRPTASGQPDACPSSPTPTPRISRHEPSAVSRRLALRQRASPHRPRGRLRRALRRVQPLHADGGPRRADGLRHRRARHPDPDRGRRGRGHSPGARRREPPGDRGGPRRTRGLLRPLHPHHHAQPHRGGAGAVHRRLRQRLLHREDHVRCDQPVDRDAPCPTATSRAPARSADTRAPAATSATTAATSSTRPTSGTPARGSTARSRSSSRPSTSSSTCRRWPTR